MNVLIIGAGGREHALAWKCRQSPKITTLHVTPGNGGIESIADCWYLTDHQEILAKAKAEKIQLAIVGQEDYLVEGLTELLEAENIAVFGPSQAAARLEGSKVFAKEFMERNHIPTAGFGKFDDVGAAKSYLKEINAPYVIKANGLAAGKGVLICSDLETAEQGLDEIMVKRQFGNAGAQVVIEEFLEGEEASFFVFTDGKNHIRLPSLQDHKRQLELDQGLNTGGMGCYAPAPLVTDALTAKVVEQVVEPTLRGMAEEGYPYKGILYIGLMIKDDQPRVVEYNIRFGDPECQPLMMLLDSDLVEIALAVAECRLNDMTVQWKQQSAVTVILASGGYPGSYEKGFTIQGLEEVKATDQQMVFHAGTKRDQNRYLTAGGRVLGITCLGKDLEEALKMAYQNVAMISWPGAQYRRDIGLKGLKRATTGKKALQVAIIMGSKSDQKIADKATTIFDQCNVAYEVIVSSAHRTPERTRQFIHEAEQRGAEVFIAIAGMAAHLPGVVAAETRFPVIGVPGNASTLGGQDALLSIVQMPPGIPVATVGIDRGDNAALLAVQILSIKYPYLKAYHFEYRLQMEQKVIASN
ncbi:MAG: phosphoribosylamine--glycine ligase [Deltaproteobacteria bacterium]|nr:phosphoribosylamine--glycine ligase [Deltaproteobacteria bacterium]